MSCAALSTVAPPQPLDAPLPTELTGRAQGWFTRYRRYPVFSAPWAGGRALAWAPVALLVLGGIALAGCDQSGQWPWAAVLGLSMHLLLPVVVGPWLGVCARAAGRLGRKGGRSPSQSC